MLKSDAAAYLAGVTQVEGAQASAPTNLHVITGEVGQKSEDGKTTVSVDGLVFSEEDSQEIEMDTLGGLEEGDIATIILTGEAGHGMTPLAIGAVGSVDRINAKVIETQLLLADKADIQDLTAATARIDDLEADHVTVTDFTAATGRIGDLEADNVTINGRLQAAELDIDGIQADYLKAADLQAEQARVGNLLANKANVSDLTAATGRIDDLEADHVSVSDFQAEQANIDTLQANTADIATIRANSAKVQNLTAAQLEADHATISTLDTTYATIANLNAANGRITNLESTKANISDLEADYITADEIEATYMHANMSNSDVAWIENGTIKNGAIVSAMINDVSANKLTAGTINGSVINVTNLNADNITTGTINGQRIGEGSLSLSKLEDDVYTEAEVNNIVDGLNDRIDGAIETHTGTAVPTLNNSPASSWNTTALKDEHVGDVYYVVNSQSQQNGYCYRFTKSGSTYSWQLIKDSDVTAALSRLTTAEGKITTFDSDISTLKTDTGTLTTRTTNLETRMSDAEDDILDKVDTTTFNEVSDTVDAHSQTISQHTTAISNKADSSTVTAVTNRVSKNEQDISGINTTIGQLQTTVASKADGSTVSTISNKLNTVSDTVDGHTQTLTNVQNTLSTKADSSTVSTLTTKVNTVSDTVDGHTQRLSSVEDTLETKADGSTVSTISTKVNNISDTVDGHTSQLTSITSTQTSMQSTLDKTVKSSIQLWYSKANTTAPNKPTSQVTSTSTSGGAWRIVVPAYNASYPNYYYCWQYEYVDGTYGWSAVVRDIAMGESQATARTADSNASAAVTTANTASTNASTALTTANTANTNASEAKTAATTASTTASEAKTTAETAASDASTAKSNAASAVTTANSASTTATNAQSTANANIKSSVQLWFTKANSTAPNKPTSVVSTSNANTANAWNLVVPVWNSSYPHYFYCYQQQKGDGTYQWTNVVYDRATSEAQQLANTTSTNLSTLQTNYATFKQTTEQFESTVGETYATKQELAKLEVGGRNYLLNTENPSSSNPPKPIGEGITWGGLNGSNNTALSFSDGIMKLTSTATTGEHFVRLNTPSHSQCVFDAMGVGPHDNLVLSGYIRATFASSDSYVTVRVQPSNGTSWVNTITLENLFTGEMTTSAGTVSILTESTSEFVRFAVRISIPESMAAVNAYFSFQQYGTFTVGDTIEFRRLKLERGTKPTDWSPAPEDTEASIASVESRVSTAETSIIQTNNQVALKANSSDVYTKTAVDGKITQEATARTAAITAKANEITSTVSQTYTTKQEFADLEVGGRNLLFLTRDFETKSGSTTGGYLSDVSLETRIPIVSETYKGYAVRHFMTSEISASTYYDLTYASLLNPISGKSYIFSFYAKGTGKVRTHFYPNANGGTYKNTGSQGQSNILYDGHMDFTVSSDWQRFWVRFEIGGTQGTNARHALLRVFGGNDIFVCGLKFEEGTKATDWTPAPEDVESRVTAAETAIEQNATAIALRATKTDVYQGAQPNLMPMFSMDFDDIYNATSNPDGYWNVLDSSRITQGENGWAHVSSSTSGTTRFSVNPDFGGEIKPSTTYTVLAEIKNLTSTGTVQFTPNINAQWSQTSYFDTILQFVPENGSKYITLSSHSSFGSETTMLYGYFYLSGTSPSVECDVRISLYEGEYSGPYKPYSGKYLYATQGDYAELKVTTDGITSTVSKISGVKYLEAASAGWSLANIKSWCVEGTTGGWSVRSTEDVRAGDTVYIKGYDVTRQCTVYIKGTVNSVTSTAVYITSHGYEDVLPSDVVISSINQSAESVKIQASRVEIDGTAVFNAIKSSMDAAYDANGAAATAKSEAISAAANDATNKANEAYEKIRSQGIQLVTNGNGYLGNNTNWPALTFDGSKSNGSPGSFTRPVGNTAIFSDEKFPIDPSKQYIFEFDAMSAGGTGRLFSFLQTFDVDGNAIYANNVLYFQNTLTTLASDLNVGDTTIKLTSAANFAATTYDHQRSLIFWDYANSFGYTYPTETYSRNFYEGVFADDSKVNKSTGVITLKSGWAGPKKLAGTPVSQNHSGVTYNYSHIDVQIPDTWTHYSAIISGVDTVKDGSEASGKFRQGSATARVGFLWNYGASGNNQGQIWVTNISVKEATPDLSDAVSRTQRIWYRWNSATAPAAPTTWVTKGDDGSALWTKMHVAITSTHKYIYTCEQYEMADGTIGHTDVLLDNTITVIDGGNIITDTITANKLKASDINASKSLTVGAMTDAAAATILNSNISVGGRNLASSLPSNWKRYTVAESSSAGATWDAISASGSTTRISVVNLIPVDGNYVTVSLASGFDAFLTFFDANGYMHKFLSWSNLRTIDLSNYSGVTAIGLTVRKSDNSAITIDEITNVKLKLERGNKATDWTPAPEDVDADISEAAQTATNYITTIDANNGIKIANASPSSATTYLQLASTFLDFIRGGVSMLKAWVDGSVAKVRVGAEQIDGTATFNTLTDGEGIKLRRGTTVLSQFATNLIELGKNGYDATISLLNNGIEIYATDIDTDHRIHFGRITSGDSYLQFAPWSTVEGDESAYSASAKFGVKHEFTSTRGFGVSDSVNLGGDGFVGLTTALVDGDDVPLVEAGVTAATNMGAGNSEIAIIGDKVFLYDGGGNTSTYYGPFPMSDVASAIPVTLYDNASASASAAATLSETAANFKRLTIFYKDTDGNYSSTDVWSPNGKRVSLSLTWINGASTQEMYQRVRWVTISGTTISTYKGSGDSKYRTGQVKLGATASVANSDYISIVHVIGYR